MTQGLGSMRKDVDDAVKKGLEKQYSDTDTDSFLAEVYATNPSRDQGVIIYRDAERWNVELRQHKESSVEVSCYEIPFRGKRVGHDEIQIDKDLLDYNKAFENLPDGFLDNQENPSKGVPEVGKYYKSLNKLREDISDAILKKEEPDRKFNQFKDDSFLLD